MNLFRNLRVRLLLLVLVVAIPPLVVTIYSGMEQRALALAQAKEEAFRSIRSLADSYDSFVVRTRQRLISLSFTQEMRDPAACAAYLSRLSEENPLAGESFVVTIQGELFCAPAADAPPIGLIDPTLYRQAAASGEVIFGEPVVDEQANHIFIPLAKKIEHPGAAEQTVAVALVDISATVQQNIIDDLPDNSAILIVDPTGKILIRYPEVERWAGQSLPDVPVIREFLTHQEEGAAEVEGVDGILRLYAFTPIQLSPAITAFFSVGIPRDTVYATPNRLFRQNLIWTLAAALFAIVFAWFGGDIFFLRVVSLTAERDAAERKLKEANAVLEERVIQRTAQLADVNRRLEGELEERQRTVAILRRREAELSRLLILLERSNHDLQDFAYITSHDLQEPLRKIQAFGERLTQRYRPALGEEGAMFVDRMATSAMRMQNMINDLLEYSRVSTRGQEFTPVNLNDVIRDVISDLELRINETGGKITVAPLPVIDADPNQMHQLFLNLLGNALKFHRPGTPPIITVSGEVIQPDGNADEARLKVCIEDNGIGFEEKYAGRIFQPFQRLYSKDTFEGSGIGLAVCRKIIDRHNGEIYATSTPGEGSRFFFILPIRQKKKESEQV